MSANFKMGIAISLGFMVVAVLFRAIGMEGVEGSASDVAFEEADDAAAAPAAGAAPARHTAIEPATQAPRMQ